jgi:fluoride ion exporter CrcB/FEX
MADERGSARDTDARRTSSWTEWFPWLRLFRTFLVALDPFKLLVAAFGIVVTALGWWLISVLFWNSWSEYNDANYAPKPDATPEQAAKVERQKLEDRNRYLLMAELAGPGGRLRSMPWFEDRGPNPYYLAKRVVSGNEAERIWARDKFTHSTLPTLVEPLRKFLTPIIGLFDARGNFWSRLYLFLILLWFLIVWAFAGGVITRMAVLQLAGKEGGGLRESIRFVASRYLSYLSSPLVPLGIVLAIVIGCVIFGAFHLIPLVGDIFVDGLFWWIPIAAGFVMALLLVGLVGYPLMYTTLSTEGSDTFDALSRSYNYVYESPWSYLWYSLVAVVYGVVVILFVVFMTSLMVYLGKWGVAQTPWADSLNRNPDYLFVYSPTSFGWRQLMLDGTPIAIDDAGAWKDRALAEQYLNEYRSYNHIGAGMVAFWITVIFLLMLGFTYSYFWTAASTIYLLMRRKVDETEMDEVYIEDEEPEEPLAPPKMSPTSAPAGTTQMVESPSLRVTTPPGAMAESPATPPATTPPATAELPAPPSAETAPTATPDGAAKPPSESPGESTGGNL